MLETMQERERERASGTGDSTEAPQRSRWGRTRAIWILIILSLAPGFVAVAFRDQWEQLPPGVHWSAYLLSAMLLGAACSLIFTSGSKQGSERTVPPDSPSNDT